MLVFVLHQSSLHYEIWIILLSQFPLIPLQTRKEMSLFIAQVMSILESIGMVFLIIWEMFHMRISLNSVFLLLLLTLIGPRLKLMYISPSSSTWFSGTIAHKYHFFHRNHICHSSKKSLPKWNSDRQVFVAKGFSKLRNMLMLIKQKSLSFPRKLTLKVFGKLLIVFSQR